MAHDVRVEQQVGRRLAVVRRLATRSQLPRVIQDACGIVWRELRERHVPGAGRHVAVYLDGDINLEVGVELDAPLTGSGEVVPSATPAGEVATTTHFGPYGGLGEAHTAILAWCASHGYVPSGPCWEIYGHWEDAWNRDASRIRTDVCYLVVPAEDGHGTATT